MSYIFGFLTAILYAAKPNSSLQKLWNYKNRSRRSTKRDSENNVCHLPILVSNFFSTIFLYKNKLCVIVQPQSPKALRLRKLITEITQKKTVKTDTTITHIPRSSVHTNSFWQHFSFQYVKKQLFYYFIKWIRHISEYNRQIEGKISELVSYPYLCDRLFVQGWIAPLPHKLNLYFSAIVFYTK